ncbi:MAG: hypothetical protein PHU25_14890 [Deltaproteobacteria bacterium]|nr:hypothetical protein [Deltaproteobacteria bacterium]
MKTIETTGIVDQEGRLVVRDRLGLKPLACVRVIVLAESGDEVDEMMWMKAASANEVFEFLADPGEDIYTVSDGKPINDAA